MASKHSPPVTVTNVGKPVVIMTDAELRDHLHTEIQRKSKLCANPTYECSQPRVDSFDYCSRHILREPRALFRQCTYIYPNGKKCPNALPKYDIRIDPTLTTLCFQHSRQTQLRKTHCLVGTLRNVEDNVTLLNSVAHYVKIEPPPDPTARFGQEEEIDVVSPQADPFLPHLQVNEIEVAMSNSRKRRRILDYASDSSTDKESISIMNTARDYGHIESSDESDSDSSPLNHANAFTREEVLRLGKEKMIELQNLYFNQLDMLHQKLRDERRRYLHSVRRERELCCSLRQQAKKSARDKKYYNELKALNCFHRRHGLDAVFYKKYKEKRTRAVDCYAPKIPGFSRCIFTEGGVKCCERVLPCSKYCRKHVLEDKRQCLFRACAVEKGGVICQEVIPGLWDDYTCVLHICLPAHRQYTQKKYESETEEEEPEVKKMKKEEHIEWIPIVTPAPSNENDLKVKVIKVEQFPLRTNLEPGMGTKRFDDEAPCCSKSLIRTNKRQDAKNITIAAPDNLNTTIAHTDEARIISVTPATVLTGMNNSHRKATNTSKAGNTSKAFTSLHTGTTSTAPITTSSAAAAFLAANNTKSMEDRTTTKVVTISTIDGAVVAPYPSKYAKEVTAAAALLAANPPKSVHTTTAATAPTPAKASRAATVTTMPATNTPRGVVISTSGTTSRAASTSTVARAILSTAPKVLPTLTAAQALMAANAPRSASSSRAGVTSKSGATSRAGTTSKAATSAKTTTLTATNTPRAASTSRGGTSSRAATISTVTTGLTTCNTTPVVTTMTAAEALLAANPPKGMSTSRGRTTSRAVTITAVSTAFTTAHTSPAVTNISTAETFNAPNAVSAPKGRFASRAVTITTVSPAPPPVTTMTAAAALLAANPPKGVSTVRGSTISRAVPTSTATVGLTPSNAQKVISGPSAAEALMAANRSRSMSSSRVSIAPKTAPVSTAPSVFVAPRAQKPLTITTSAMTLMAANRSQSMSYSQTNPLPKTVPISTAATSLPRVSVQKSVISTSAPASTSQKVVNSPSAAEALMAANRPRSLSYSRTPVPSRALPILTATVGFTTSNAQNTVTISPPTQTLMTPNIQTPRASSRASISSRGSRGATTPRATTPSTVATSSGANSIISAAAAIMANASVSNTTPSNVTISSRKAITPAGFTTSYGEKTVTTTPVSEALIVASRPRSRSSSRAGTSSKSPKAAAPSRAPTPRGVISKVSTTTATTSSSNAGKVLIRSLADNTARAYTINASSASNAAMAVTVSRAGAQFSKVVAPTSIYAPVASTPTTTVVTTSIATDSMTTAANRPATSTAGVTRRSHKHRY